MPALRGEQINHQSIGGQSRGHLGNVVQRYPAILGDFVGMRLEDPCDWASRPDGQDVAALADDSEGAEADQGFHADGQFFGQFPHEGGSRSFTRFEVSAGEAPATTAGYGEGAADHQVAALVFDDADDAATDA